MVACPRGDLATRVVQMGISWVELPMTRHVQVRDYTAFLAVRKLLQNADVVHLHSSKAGALGRMALATMGSERPGSAFTPHGWSWLIGGSLAPAYRAIEWTLAPITDVIIGVGRDEIEEAKRVLGGRVPRLELIPNGVDLEYCTVDGPVAPREPEPLIVLVGRLTPAKGQDIALRVLAEMRTTQARLRLVGDGPEEPMLRSLADSLGVADRVEWVGLADPRPHMRAADLVLMPSRWDAAPLVLLEALACGAVVVCSDAIGSIDLIGQAGIVVAAGDVPAFATVLDELVDDPARRAQVRQEAIRQSHRLPTRSDFREAHLQLWRSLLDQSRSGR